MFALAVGLAVASPNFARAETDRDRAAARSAADTGADAFDQGRYEQALELFGRAEQLVHAPTHLLFMARSLAKLGRLVESHEAYMKIINEQLAADAPRAFKTARTEAENEIGGVEARLAHVTVTVHGASAGTAALRIDQADVPAAEQGIPIPMDPGPHIFSARAGEAQSDERTVTLREGGNTSVELTLRDPAPSGMEPTGSNQSSSAGTNDVQPDRGRASKHSSARRIVAYSSFGLAAVGAGVGAYFAASAFRNRNEATATRDACDWTYEGCGDDQQLAVKDHESKADTARNWTIGLYAATAAALGTGIVLLATEPHASSGRAFGPLRNLRVAAGFASLTAAGEF